MCTRDFPRYLAIRIVCGWKQQCVRSAILIYLFADWQSVGIFNDVSYSTNYYRTRIGCNRTLTIARITRQESHRELMISLASRAHNPPVYIERGRGRIIFLLTLREEATLWADSAIRERPNICYSCYLLPVSGVLHINGGRSLCVPDCHSNAVVTSRLRGNTKRASVTWRYIGLAPILDCLSHLCAKRNTISRPNFKSIR